MDFELSDEQRLLKDSVERLTTQRYDFETRKKFMAEPDGWSRDMWRQYASLALIALPCAADASTILGKGAPGPPKPHLLPPHDASPPIPLGHAPLARRQVMSQPPQ